jgi:uncharacterized membrane protein
MEGGWQHWASLWANWSNDDTVRFGAQAIMDSIEMFGWDGVRWDGHFVGNHKIFLDMLNAKYPNFVHGYNIAFANPGSTLFMPPDQDDFPTVAAHHGMLMDESVRDWSHTNFSSGLMRPFYEAVCREADYEKRIGGLPLFITFDMASPQDGTFNVLCGLAAGERYTYSTSPGDFAFGPLPKFLTRYSAFIWDDTELVAKPEQYITVQVGKGPQGVQPWWNLSVWQRQMPDGRQQLLIHMLNPPGYPAFCNRVQPPPCTLSDLTVRVKDPAGAKLTRAAHISPDLAEGHCLLTAQQDGDAHKVAIPRLRTWSIVLMEYDGAAKPAFPITTPVEDAAAVFKRQKEDQEKKAAQEKATAAEQKPQPAPSYRDYANIANVDVATREKIKAPEELVIQRNGVLDVHDARGAFSWNNPVSAAVGFLGGTCQPSWVDFVGWKLGPNGCMDEEYPGSYEELAKYDVLVLDNIHSFHLGTNRRTMAADFVRGGGGLVCFGGCHNLSSGADHNTYLAEMIPVRITKFEDAVRNDQGLPLKAEEAEFFGNTVDWSKPACVFMVDTSPLKEGVKVLASAGGHPAIVASQYGKGRVVTILMNCHGNYPDGVTPYWEWSQWPKVLAACIRWAGQGSEEKLAVQAVKREVDKTKMEPVELLMAAFELDSKQFTAKLREARVNVLDTESARALLEAAVANVDKIEDMELLQSIVQEVSPYFNKSFASLGQQLVQSQHAFIREGGYEIFGCAGDKKYRPILEKGLLDEDEGVQRRALAGLAALGDDAACPAVEKYFTAGTQKLLAVSVLKRLGQPDIMKKALAVYSEMLIRRVHIKSGRRSLHEDLYGGVSFKLTPAARRKLEAEYRRVLRVEAEIKQDLRYFEASTTKLTDADLSAFVEFFQNTENREALPLAYIILSRLPAEKAGPCRKQMEQAKLRELRLLTEG